MQMRLTVQPSLNKCVHFINGKLSVKYSYICEIYYISELKHTSHTSVDAITVRQYCYCEMTHLLLIMLIWLSTVCKVACFLKSVELVLPVSLGQWISGALWWIEHNHPPADNYDGSSETVYVVSVLLESCVELPLNELRESPNEEKQQGNKYE